MKSDIKKKRPTVHSGFQHSSVSETIRINDLVRFRHPMTGEKAIGVVTQKKMPPVPNNPIAKSDPYIMFGIYCEKELIWIDSLYRELEKIDV